ncbi:MAG TPA: ATP-binding protein [Ignavibacteriaceae bacterium]|nr:ATP-binding protein [Ignavibacteriaceae bacterium]
MSTKNKNILENKMVVKSRTENLSEIREFINSLVRKIGVAPDVSENIILAVDEACTNIIKHSYKFFPDGEIIIKTKYSNNKIIITIIDYGEYFQPNSIHKPDLQEYYRHKKVGGLGMYLMKTLMDEVKYSSVPGKYNQVLLTKYVNSGS